MKVSIIIPVYNEAESITALLKKILLLIEKEKNIIWEILLIDDGSFDNTLELVLDKTIDINNINIISLNRNYGQTAAISAGIDKASGDILVTMDADLQNDPLDIPILISIGSLFGLINFKADFLASVKEFFNFGSKTFVNGCEV